MDTMTDTNAYWEAVLPHVRNDPMFGGPTVDTYGSITRDYSNVLDRNALCSQYSWTVTDPATVDFVRQHASPMVVDPIAGSGWWAWLLQQDHINVTATDINPPDGTNANNWHRGNTHVPVQQADAIEAVAWTSASHTLLLSWPPYDTDTGARTLAAYPGNRVIYIGEGPGGCCGTDDMFDQFDRDWTQIAEHRPVQFYGLHDYVTVYQRKGH